MSFFRSVFWIFFDKVFLVLLSTISFFIFALYLEPSELGKGVMYIAIPGLIAALFSGMIESPLVSKFKVDEGEYSTVLWFALGLSLIIFTVIMLIGCFVLDNTTDVFLLGIASSSIVFILASRPFLAQLRRNHDFKSIALRAFLGKCIGFGGGVAFALNGYGAFAIVVQFMLQELVSLLVMAFCMKEIIQFSFRRELLSNTLKMGRYLSITALSNSIIGKGLPLTLGAVSGAESVGLFNFANRIVALPRDAVFNGINSYALPSFSRIQSDKSVLTKQFSSSNRLSSFLVFPLFFGLAATAPLIVNTIFGSKWDNSIVYLQLLALIAVFRATYLFHSALFLVLKVPNIITKKELVTAIVSLSLVLLYGEEFGAGAGVLAMGVYTITCFFWNVLAVKKVIDYPFKTLISDFLPALSISLLMVLCVYIVESLLYSQSAILKLSASIASGAFVYITALYAIEHKNVNALFYRRFKKS